MGGGAVATIFSDTPYPIPLFLSFPLCNCLSSAVGARGRFEPLDVRLCIILPSFSRTLGYVRRIRAYSAKGLNRSNNDISRFQIPYPISPSPIYPDLIFGFRIYRFSKKKRFSMGKSHFLGIAIYSKPK